MMQQLFIAEANLPMQMFLLAAFVFPAWVMSAIDSPGLVPYLIATWAFGPEVRRINDYFGGGYESVTVLSLISSLSTLSLIIPILRYFNRLSSKVKKSLGIVFATLLYGTALGLLFSGVPAFVEGLTILLPLLFVIYIASRPYIERERMFWLKWVSTIAAIVSVYGWYQYLTAPPWDMDWMMGSGMYTSMGRPEPEGFRVFSTLNSAVPLGFFLAPSLVVGLCNKQWRGITGSLGILLVMSCLLITLVRTAWILVVVALGVYLTLQQGRNRWLPLGGIIAVALIMQAALPFLPGGEAVSSRVQSFGALSNDNSAEVRMGILGGFGHAVSNPLGRGLGATGVGAKLVSKDAGPSQGSDNGYLDLCVTLGPVVSILLIVGIIMLGKQSGGGDPSHESVTVMASSFRALSTAMLVAYGVGMLSCNTLGGVGGVLLWLVVGCPLRAEKKISRLPTAKMLLETGVPE